MSADAAIVADQVKGWTVFPCHRFACGIVGLSTTFAEVLVSQVSISWQSWTSFVIFAGCAGISVFPIGMLMMLVLMSDEDGILLDQWPPGLPTYQIWLLGL